jgi:hypothetical protein
VPAPETHAEALIRLALPSCDLNGQWLAGDQMLGGDLSAA